jgi:hypothetical protein
MEQSNYASRSSITLEEWIVVALCIVAMGAWAVQNFIFIGSSKPSSPFWLQPAAAIMGILGIIRLSTAWQQLWRAIYMIGLLFMAWAANKLLFDLLTITGTVGDPETGLPARIDWPGMITRLTAFAAAVFLARNALKAPAAGSRPPASWYGYAAFILALPYPLLRIIWAFGGTLGITSPGAAGEGFEPLIIAIPWILAAILSLLLVSPRKWIPRRLLLFAGWTATAIVASIGPVAFWSGIKMLASGDNMTKGDIDSWVFLLFYTSWFLWAIAGFAATRSYQLRTKKTGL